MNMTFQLFCDNNDGKIQIRIGSVYSFSWTESLISDNNKIHEYVTMLDWNDLTELFKFQ